MLCANCGKKNKDNDTYCAYCGAALTTIKAQKSVQKAVDAYDRKPSNRNNKNIVPTIIIIFVSLLFVLGLVLLIPIVIRSINQGVQNAGDNASDQIVITDPYAQEEGPLPSSNPYYDCFNTYEEYVLPNSSTVFLSRTDLASMTSAELEIALHEIRARHGSRFNDSNVQAYFDARPWYASAVVNPTYNSYETANLILLDVYIQQQNGTYSDPGNPYLNQFPGVDSFALTNSQNRYVTANDLKDMTETQLTIARNELYARHGYVFDDADLQSYFCTKSWYIPTSTNVYESSFNEFESGNLKLIQVYERRLEGVTFSADNPYMQYFTTSTTYIFPNSSNTSLMDATLFDTSLTKEKCILGRNEIYARHGYTFSDEELMEYFLQQDWYLPNYPVGDMSQIQLSDVERKNVEHLKALEEIIDTIPSTGSLNKSLSYQVNFDKVTLTLPSYWKSYTSNSTSGNAITFKEIFTPKAYSGMSDELGFVCQISVVPATQYTGPDDIFYKLGVLSDANGEQWYVVLYKATDVRHSVLVSNLYAQMSSDIYNIQVSPAEGYTYMPY